MLEWAHKLKYENRKKGRKINLSQKYISTQSSGKNYKIIKL